MNQKLGRQDYHYLGRYKAPLLYFYICLLTVKQHKTLVPLNGGIYLDGHIFLDKNKWDLIKKKNAGTVSGPRTQHNYYALSFCRFRKAELNFPLPRIF